MPSIPDINTSTQHPYQLKRQLLPWLLLREVPVFPGLWQPNNILSAVPSNCPTLQVSKWADTPPLVHINSTPTTVPRKSSMPIAQLD